jgi:hypothetical protein
MNWEAIGAVGEVLGGLAVLVTLIYLSIQVRQNTRFAKAQVNTSGFVAFSSYRKMVNEHAAVVVKMQKAEDLSEIDSVIAQNIISEALFAAAGGYENAKLTDPARCDEMVQSGVVILARFNWPWETNRRILDSAGYQDFTERLAAALDGKESSVGS